MTRLDLTEQMRRLRVAEARDPLESAYRAFVALSDADKAEMARMFNAAQERRAHPNRLTFETAA